MRKTTLLFWLLSSLSYTALRAQVTYTKQMKGNNSIYVYDVVATKSLRGTVVATTDPSTGNNFFLTKLDDQGNLLWSKTFVYPGAFGIKMAATKDEAIICSANVSNQNKRNGNLLFKLDSSGNVVWAKRVIGNFSGWLSTDGMVCANDGTIYSLNFVPTGQSVQQYTENGDLVWTKYLYQNGVPVYGSSFFAAATSDNGFIFSNKTGGLSLYYDHLFKISKSGEAEWSYDTDEPTNYYVYTQAANTRADGKVDFLFFRYEYFVHTLLDPVTGESQSENLGNVFSLQVYLRMHNIEAFNGKSFPFVNYTNDLHLFTRNFGLTTVAQEYPENYRYITVIHKYDSLGRICPDYTLPVTSAPDTLSFGLTRNSFTTESAAVRYTITDVMIKVRDFSRLGTVCEGDADALAVSEFVRAAAMPGLNHSLTLYPNPVKNTAMLRLTSAASGSLRLSVTNMLGITVQSCLRQISKGDNTIDLTLTNLAPGVYLVRGVLPDGSAFSRKLTKESN